MANVAKIVWASVATRVVVDDTATDEQIWAVAKDNLARNLVDNGLEGIESIQDDKELPYGFMDGEK